LDEPTAKKLVRALEKGYGLLREAEGPIFTILCRAQEFRWLELDAYQRDFVAPFQAALSQMQQGSAEWQEFSAKGDSAKRRRERLTRSFRESLVHEWGEAFRFVEGISSHDPRERNLAVAELLARTHVADGHAAHRRGQLLDPDLKPKGWLFMRMPRGCCHICRAIPDELPRPNLPSVPVHIGCMCSVYAKQS
jgi:hypothetical protein